MTPRMIRTGVCIALAAALLTLAPASAPDAWGEPKAKKAKTVAKPAKPKASIEEYQRAKAAYEKQLDAYWDDIAAKRRIRIAKRRDKQQVVLEDYVLTQPPVYSGPPRPAGMPSPRREPKDVKLPPIPRVADFIAAAAEHYKFTPHRPESDLEFKRAYAKVALDAGLTEEQAVRIYAFETGGNGTYDVQAGLTHPKKGSKPISPAVGYNQLLSTNTIGLLAAKGDDFVKVLKVRAAALDDDARKAMERRLEALGRMIAHTRSIPYAWAEHDKMAKFTRAGYGIHAAIFDRDIGPLLQTQKLLELGVVCTAQWARGAAQRRRAGADELYRRRQRLRHGDDAGRLPRQGADLELLPAARLFAQSDRQAHRQRGGTDSLDRRQDGPRLPIARRAGACRGVPRGGSVEAGAPMTSLTAHFALLKELEQEYQQIETAIADLMDEMERIPPEQRAAGEWGPSGTRTKRFIEMSERQNEIAAEIKLVSAAIESAKPANSVN